MVSSYYAVHRTRLGFHHALRHSGAGYTAKSRVLRNPARVCHRARRLPRIIGRLAVNDSANSAWPLFRTNISVLRLTAATCGVPKTRRDHLIYTQFVGG